MTPHEAIARLLKAKPQHADHCDEPFDGTCSCGLSEALAVLASLSEEGQQQDKAFTRSDQPQLRACESDPRGEFQGGSIP